jgi:hypothetical protein
MLTKMSQNGHKMQKYPNFHNDAHLFHGYARFKTFWKINTVFSHFSCNTTDFTGIFFAEVILFIVVL